MAGYMPARADFVEVRLPLLPLFSICYRAHDQQTHTCFCLEVFALRAANIRRKDRAEWLSQGFNCRGGAAGQQSGAVPHGAAAKRPVTNGFNATRVMMWIRCLTKGFGFAFVLCRREAQTSLIQRSFPGPALFSVLLAAGPELWFLLQNKLLYMKWWNQPYRGLLFWYIWAEFPPQCGIHGVYLINLHCPVTAPCSCSSRGDAHYTFPS